MASQPARWCFRKTVFASVRATTRFYGTETNREAVSLVGVPFSGGQPKPGVEEGPKVLRKAGLVERIAALGRKVIDRGDLELPKYDRTEFTDFEGAKLRCPHVCGEVSRRVADAVAEGAKDGNICVTIGGDHSIAAGTIFGHASVRKNIRVLWVDAHTDINTYKTTNSGNLHGMPLSFLVSGLQDGKQVPGYEWIKPCLNAFDIAYIGLRDIDPLEHAITEDLGIMTFSMHEVDRYGISTVVERAIESINPRLDCPIHLSYDIDSLDPIVSPSTGTAVYGGLTIREGLYIGEYVNKLGLLGALDIVEVNPKLGFDKRDAAVTTETALKIIEGCLGKHRSGYVTKRVFPYRNK